MIIRGEIDYKLTRKFSFFSNGKNDNLAEFVIINEPTMAHCDDAIAMRECVGHIFAAAHEANKRSESADQAVAEADETLNNSDAMAEFLQHAATMYGSGALEKMVAIFKRMAFNRKSPICLINSDMEFRDASWERLSIDDAIGMACCFAANFSMPRGVEKKEFARQSESHTPARAGSAIEML